MIDLSVLTVEQVGEWLQAKRCTLWADWEVARPNRRLVAAEWFLAEMTSLNEFIEQSFVPADDI